MKKRSSSSIILLLIFTLILALSFLLFSCFGTNGTSSNKLSGGEPLTDYLFSLPDNSTHKFQLGDKEYLFEVANSSQSKLQGLSGREKIGSDGLLFVFDKPDYHGIWMKEMKFNIDLIWVLDDMVVDVTKNASAPQTSDELMDLLVYRPKSISNVVIEVESGFVDERGIEPGMTISLPNKEKLE